MFRSTVIHLFYFSRSGFFRSGWFRSEIYNKKKKTATGRKKQQLLLPLVTGASRKRCRGATKRGTSAIQLPGRSIAMAGRLWPAVFLLVVACSPAHHRRSSLDAGSPEPWLWSTRCATGQICCHRRFPMTQIWIWIEAGEDTSPARAA